MKIILVCFLHLDELPPLMTAIKVLAEKHRIFYIGVDDYNESYQELFGNNVEFINILGREAKAGSNIKSRIDRFLYWRIYPLYLAKANAVVKYNYNSDDLLWIHHEYTLMHMRKLNIPYYLTMYELHPDLFKPDCELKKRIKMADKVVVPEYARAAIVQACVRLKKLPNIIPNKPYEYELSATELDDNPMQKLMQSAHAEGRKIILYSGIFLRERKLDTFIEAVQRLSDKYVIVLVGRKSEYLDELIKKYPVVKYLGFYNPPLHLSIIEKADVGILTYVADSGSINSVFCAPNKIWEYAKFGIPMICNDIPGLKYTVEYNNLGYCCDVNSIDSICDALNNIYDHYEELSENALDFYKTVDVKRDILKLIGE